MRAWHTPSRGSCPAAGPAPETAIGGEALTTARETIRNSPFQGSRYTLLKTFQEGQLHQHYGSGDLQYTWQNETQSGINLLSRRTRIVLSSHNLAQCALPGTAVALVPVGASFQSPPPPLPEESSLTRKGF